MRQDFYVYEHRRRDNGAVFYVGAGSGYRATVTQHRSRQWRETVAAAGGMQIFIRAHRLDLELAHLVEREIIDQRRRQGHPLVNKTNGGYGSNGFAWPAEVLQRRAESQRGQKRPTVSEKLKGRPKSAEHRAALSASKTGKKASAETRQAMSDARKLRPLKRATCERCGYEGTYLTVAHWHGENCKKGL